MLRHLIPGRYKHSPLSWHHPCITAAVLHTHHIHVGPTLYPPLVVWSSSFLRTWPHSTPPPLPPQCPWPSKHYQSRGHCADSPWEGKKRQWNKASAVIYLDPATDEPDSSADISPYLFSALLPTSTWAFLQNLWLILALLFLILCGSGGWRLGHHGHRGRHRWHSLTRGCSCHWLRLPLLDGVRGLFALSLRHPLGCQAQQPAAWFINTGT